MYEGPIPTIGDSDVLARVHAAPVIGRTATIAGESQVLHDADLELADDTL